MSPSSTPTLSDATTASDTCNVQGAHPVEKGAYTLDTPAIEETYESVHRWVKNRIPGAMIVSPPRYGKTQGIRFMRMLLHQDFPTTPIFTFNCISTKTVSEDRFYQWMLASVNHAYAQVGKAAAKYARIVEFLREQVLDSQQNRLVLFLDDSQKLHPYQYNWFMDIYNELEAANCKMTLLLVGQPELLHQRAAFVMAKHNQIVGRFMVQTCRFHGVRNQKELSQILGSYDEATEYPPGSGRSFAAHFYPYACSKGWRFASLAPGLWSAFSEARPGRGARFEIPMQYCISACEYLLQEYADSISEMPTIGQRALEAAVATSGFAESETMLPTPEIQNG